MSPHHTSQDGIKSNAVDLDKVETVDDLVNQWGESRVFSGGHLAKGVEILDRAKKEGASIMVGLAGAMVPGGMKKVIVAAMRAGFIQSLTTTGAMITHDLIESIGGAHTHSVEYKDDNELKERGIDRVYDAFVKPGSFESFEDFIKEALKSLIQREANSQVILTPSELVDYLGSLISDNESIVRTAHELKIPIFVPALSDSVLGLQIWLFSQFNPLIIDATKDLGKIQDKYHEREKNCAFILGGGVPKNYTLQAALMASRQYNYAVQVTMDRVETGGLSGADLEETKSWGKLEPDAETVTIISDLTIALPIIIRSLLARQNGE